MSDRTLRGKRNEFDELAKKAPTNNKNHELESTLDYRWYAPNDGRRKEEEALLLLLPEIVFWEE